MRFFASAGKGTMIKVRPRFPAGHLTAPRGVGGAEWLFRRERYGVGHLTIVSWSPTIHMSSIPLPPIP